MKYNSRSFKDAKSLRQSSNHTIMSKNLAKNSVSVRSEAVTFDNGIAKKRDQSEIGGRASRNFDEIRIKEQSSVETRSYNRRNTRNTWKRKGHLKLNILFVSLSANTTLHVTWMGYLIPMGLVRQKQILSF